MLVRVGFVGAGRASGSLSKFLAQRGAVVTGFYSRNRDKAERCAASLGAQVFDDLRAVLYSAQFIFIGVSDRNIQQIGAQLKEFDLRGKGVCHLSGCLTSQILLPCTAKVASVHPVASFPNDNSVPSRLTCVLEGDGAGEFELALEALGVKCVTISGQAKPLYHGAAVVASNYVCAMQCLAMDMLKECGFSQETAAELFAPLTMGTVENTCRLKGIAAMSGPVVRGDTQTIERHMQVLTKTNPRWASLYREMADYIEYAVKNGEEA